MLYFFLSRLQQKTEVENCCLELFLITVGYEEH